MHKIWLIIQREYLTRVRKRSFLLTTILVPIIIIGFYAVIIAIAISDSGKSDKVAVIDRANLFEGRLPAGEKNQNIQFDFINNETEESFKPKYGKEGYSVFLYIPPLDLKNPDGLNLHSQSAVSITTKSRIEKTVNKAIENKRLQSENIDPEKYQSIKSDVDIPTHIDSREGEKRSVEGVAYGVSFAAGILIYIVLLIYGSMVMRGVAEEKTNRISEVIVSSVKPFQLMMGKIIGIGAVGITQFIIWIVLISLLQVVIPLLFPSLAAQISSHDIQGNMPVGGGNAGTFIKVTEGLHSLDIGLILFCFIFYFIGGYLMYSSLFAAVGSVVSEDPQEAQQLVFPIMMPIILGFVIMTKAVQDPNSELAVFGSLFPLTSPIVMMGRVTFGVPWPQLAASMIILILFFLFCTWMAGKIYRTGILMYGKRPSWKEMMKWAFRK